MTKLRVRDVYGCIAPVPSRALTPADVRSEAPRQTYETASELTVTASHLLSRQDAYTSTPASFSGAGEQQLPTLLEHNCCCCC
eukprot:jgi/Chrzof1/6472/Cz18g12100.t1